MIVENYCILLQIFKMSPAFPFRPYQEITDLLFINLHTAKRHNLPQGFSPPCRIYSMEAILLREIPLTRCTQHRAFK